MVKTGSDVALAFGLTSAAGLSTCLGAAVVFNKKLASLASKELLAGSLGLSAGVMIYVSFVEVFAESETKFHEAGNGEGTAHLYTSICFFSGFAVIYMLDRLVHMISPHHHDIDIERLRNAPDVERVAAAASTECDESEFHQLETPGKAPPDEAHKLKRTGLMTALSLGLHNFPEGLATFVATLDDPSVGGAFAVAIAIHNIPEGIAVAMPVYYATGSRKQAFFWAFLSALAEPFGAFLAWLILADNFTDTVYGILFGLVGGMMVCISLKELLPTARRYDPNDRYVTNFSILGMIIMALSLVLFRV